MEGQEIMNNLKENIYVWLFSHIIDLRWLVLNVYLITDTAGLTCSLQVRWQFCVCSVSGKSSQWKGTVLDQVPVNPSLYLIKYDGFDCIYGLELYNDERVVGLEVLPDRVGEHRRAEAELTLATDSYDKQS